MRLSEHLVAFVDLLGFRNEMLKVKEQPEKAERLLDTYLSIVGKPVENVLDSGKALGHAWRYRGFSDNFIVAIELDRNIEHGGGAFALAYLVISEFQFRLALKGWFIRGGLDVGPFYMDEHTVYGPALVDAYKIEDKTAIQPRVVLSDKCVDIMQKYLHLSYGTKIEKINYLPPTSSDGAGQYEDFLTDEDGMTFINYLNFPFAALRKKEQAHKSFLQHKKAVEEKLDEFKGDPGVFWKYRWVASYHNTFCSRYYPDKEETQISSHKLK